MDRVQLEIYRTILSVYRVSLKSLPLLASRTVCPLFRHSNPPPPPPVMAPKPQSAALREHSFGSSYQQHEPSPTHVDSSKVGTKSRSLAHQPDVLDLRLTKFPHSSRPN